MIGYIRGEIFEIHPTYAIVLAGGVGYKVFATTRTLEKLQVGEESSFYIISIIKEDAFDLYGFENTHEKHLFELIISVSGIGPRTGLMVLSQFELGDIVSAVREGDAGFFTGVPRLGKKNASKLIIELKSKIGEAGDPEFTFESNDESELMSALKQLGFHEKEINPVLSLAYKNGGSLEEKITFALKQLGRN